MSAWLLAAREVYQAGGSVPVAKLTCPLAALYEARRNGVIEKAGGPCGSRRVPPATLTPLGQAVCEGRVQKVDVRLGHRWRATWLAALPRANEVRLTHREHPAQNDGTCYW